MTDEQKSKINNSLEKVKEAHSNKDIDKIDSSISELNEVWSEVSSELYKQTESQPDDKNEDGVVDTDFEEVK